MILLQANNIEKSFGAHPVLINASLVLQEKERVGLVGVNGCGKSTFLQCLTGNLAPDAGVCSHSAFISIGYLQQLVSIEPDCTAWDAVMGGFPELLEQRSALALLEEQISSASSPAASLLERYSRITEAYERANGYACETTVRRVLSGLGFSSQQFSQSWQSFSGGEKTRLNLARLLATKRDVLILDEPTNHLDLQSLEWLENYLLSYSGAILLVSHDRRFLERVATRMVHLHNGLISSYPGSYSHYLQQRAREELSAQRAYEKQQEYICRTEEYIRRYKAGIKSKQARGRQSQLDRLERLDRDPISKSIKLASASEASESGQIVLQAENLHKSYGIRRILAGAELILRRGERLALVGPNGCGKTTLLQILAGALSCDEGQVQLGSRVRLAYFDQENENLRPGNTVLEEIVNNSSLNPGEARNRLGAMLFHGDDVFKPVTALSGGERARLTLLKMIITEGNLLILDEPTNHLDIESRQAVEELLSEYQGTLLAVSHDRYFLDQVADGILVIKDGQIIKLQGNYSSCQESIASLNQPSEPAQSPSRVKKPYRTGISEEEKAARRSQRQLAARIEHLEESIEKLEETRAQLEESLAKPETYLDENLSRLRGRELKQTIEQLNRALEEWEGLMILQEQGPARVQP